MEGGREEANAGQPHTLSSSCSENKTPDRTVIKTEPAEDYHQTPRAALGCSERAGCTHGCSGNQKESSDGVCAGIIKQEKTELGEGSVVMRGEDFWVEVDPAYESEDEPTVTLEVKVKPENESREIGLGVRFRGDKTGVSSDRQVQSFCPVSAGPPGMGGVAADSRAETGVPVTNVLRNIIPGIYVCVPSVLPVPNNTTSLSLVVPVVVGPPPGVGSFPGMNVVPGSSRPNFGSRVSLGFLPGMVPTPTSSGTTGQGDPLKKNHTILPKEVINASNVIILPPDPNFAPVQKVQKTCVCCECGEKFDNDKRLREHGKEVHGNTKMYGPCPECGKKFGYRESLETHLATLHKGSGKYPCSECGKQFPREGHLEDHLAFVHQGLRQFTCLECGKKFGRERSLKIHTASVHRGEKNFCCAECGKKFASSSQLNIHVAHVHGGAGKFACTECDKTYPFQFLLKKHVAIVHRGEKNFLCFVCGRAFGEKGSLDSHLQSVHVGGKFSCPECGEKFRQKCQVKKHIADVHCESLKESL